MASGNIYQSAMRMIAKVFDWGQLSQQETLSDFVTNTFDFGVVALQLGEFAITLGSGNTISTPTVSVGSGIAYDVDSQNIYISTSDTVSYDASNPSTQTDDGLGNLILTPLSTGHLNVPVSTGNNYIWIDYLATIDPSVYTLNKITRAKIFYKQTDGYKITVTTTLTPPTASSLYLGSVLGVSGAVQAGNISQSGRTYFQITASVAPIQTAQLNKSDATALYSPGTTYFTGVGTHIKAVGTGTVNAQNPHGTSLADLGISTYETVIGHRQLEHGNGIIAGTNGDPFPATSAMGSSVTVQNPGNDSITIYALQAEEFAIINGIAYTVYDIFGAVPQNATINFPVTVGASGTYKVYWDTVIRAFGITTGDISADITKLWLSSVTWTLGAYNVYDTTSGASFWITSVTDSTHLVVSSTTGVTAGDSITQGVTTTTVSSVTDSTHLVVVSTTGLIVGNHNSLSSLVDKRIIGSTLEKFQRWHTTSRQPAPIAGQFGFNLTTNLFEYWDGLAWQQPVNSSTNSTVPTGAMLDFAGVTAPSGFLGCDGSAVSRTTYAALFSVLGTTWGSGDGSTTFNIPDFRRRVSIGSGGSGTGVIGSVVGDTGGTETHTLTAAQLPTSIPVTDPGHTHGVTDPGHDHPNGRTNGGGQTGGGASGYPQPQATSTGSSATGVTVNSNSTGITVGGSGDAHNIMQPSAVVLKIIKF